MRSGGRVVEGARLESVYTVTPYRGFESHPLRHFLLFYIIFLMKWVPVTKTVP